MIIIALLKIEWYTFLYQYLFFFLVLLVFAWFILIWIGVFGFFVVVVISEFVLVSRIFRKIWMWVTGISTTNDLIDSLLLLFSRWNIYRFISLHHLGIAGTKQEGLSPMNDKEIIYPYNIIAISSKQEMGIKKITGQVVLVDWSNIKFFKSPSCMADSKDNYLRDLESEREWQTVRIIIYEILRAKGKMHQRIAALSQFASLLRLAEALP